jgi:HK97 family phage major capsid protein
MKRKQQLQQQHRAKRAELGTILDKAAADIKTATPEVLEQIKTLKAEIASLEVLIETASDEETKDLEIASAEQAAAALSAGKHVDPPANGGVIETAAGQPGAGAQRQPHVASPVQGEKEGLVFATLAEQLKAVRDAEYGNVQARAQLDKWRNYHTAAATGGSVNSAPDGGVLIQPNFSQKIIETAIDGNAIMNEVTKIPITNGNQLVLPMVKDKDCSGGSIRAGIKAYLSDEAETVLKSKPAFERFELSLRKISVVAWGTDELLEDVHAYEAYIMANVPDQLGYQLGEEVLFGDGAKGPKGILHSSNLALITVAKESGQSAEKLMYKNIVKMRARMWTKGGSRAKFFYNKEHEVNFPGLYIPTGSNAGTLIYTPPGSVPGNLGGFILGAPAVECPNLPAPGTLNDIIYADLGEYIFIDKGGLKGQSSIHVEFLKGEKVFKWDYRMNGAPGWQQVHTPPKNTGFTHSPFINLEAR